MRLRRALFALLHSALLSGTVAAQIEAPPLVSIERQGYAFEFPRVLAEQRLFGIAHGISLLATACLDAPPKQSDAAADAYTRWYVQQQLLVEDLKNELAVFYYGPHADEASWAHVAAALKLRDKLNLAPDSEQLQAACATLPQALEQPRYDLNALFQLEAAVAAMTQATRVDTEVAACGAKLSEAERNRLAAAHAEWQRTENAAADTARAQLMHYWQVTAAAGNPEDWLKALAQRHAKPSASTCAGLADWLTTADATIAQSFASAPVILASEEAPADHAVSAVQLGRPEIANAAENTTVDATETQAAPLFDTLMRLFDERPYEAAAARPARSQRAHP